MPEPAGNLNVTCRGLGDAKMERVNEIASKVGFHLGHKMSIGDEEYIYNFQPFELSEENKELILELENLLSDDFPNVMLEEGRNKDAGELSTYTYHIYVTDDRYDDSNLDEKYGGYTNTNLSNQEDKNHGIHGEAPTSHNQE